MKLLSINKSKILTKHKNKIMKTTIMLLENNKIMLNQYKLKIQKGDK